MVAAEQTRPMTIDQFREYVEQPENSDQVLELINGEIVEVSPSRTRNSEFGQLITVEVHIFCRAHNLPCHTSGADGTYEIQGHVVVPDFAYKPTPMSDDYPDPEPPLWVVEVVSPTDKAPDIRAKRQIYIQAGILYWEMYSKSKSIDVYAPGQPPRTLGIDDTLDGGAVLPDFRLPVRDLFAE
ncbi:MAG: Uma2 family endonuclease [Chloroflexota bacterium]